MGVRGRSAGLLAIGAFVAGVAAGVVVGMRWGPPVGEPAPSTSTGVDGIAPAAPVPHLEAGGRPGPSGGPERGPPPAPGRVPVEVPVDLPVVPADTEVASAPPAESELRPALGWATLVVRARETVTGTAPEAVAYVLPAGAPGVDDVSTVPHGAVGEAIRVPAPGTYDVGLRLADPDGGPVLVRDVVVKVGETRTVEMKGAPPARRPIRMRPAAGVADQLPTGWRFRVRWSPPKAVAPEYPGRGDPLTSRQPVTARFVPTTEGETEPLPGEDPWFAEVFIEMVDIDDPPAPPRPGTRAVARPSTARPGETVEIALESFSYVSVTADAPVGGWPAGTGPLRLVWEGVGPPERLEVENPWELEKGVGFRVVAGPGHVVWSGPGILAGRSATLEPTAELRAEVELRIELDPRTVRVPGRLHLRLRAGDAPVDEESPATVYLQRGSGEHGVPTWFRVDRSWSSDPEIEFDPSSGGEPLNVLVVRRGRSSGIVSCRGGGTVDVELAPAGYLIVVPTTDGTDDPGSTLERIDGSPMFQEGRDGPTGAELAAGVEVTPGLVLGPFPEGLLRLRLVRGGIPVAELRPTIRAQEYVPLRIPR